MVEDTEKNGKALALANWLLDKSLMGIPPLTSAADLAAEYLDDDSYRDDDHRVRALISWETSKNFSTGFVTGVGGLATLPLAIPTALGASWVVQARMAGAIAAIYGHDLQEDRVRTLALLSILGDSAALPLKEVGIAIAKKSAHVAIKRIPGELLVKINQQVGYRLLTKSGTQGVVNLVKILPVVGGVVGGTFDAMSCRATAKAARMLFAPPKLAA